MKKNWKTITAEDEDQIKWLLNSMYHGYGHSPHRLTADGGAPCPVMDAREHFKAQVRRNINRAPSTTVVGGRNSGAMIINEATCFDLAVGYDSKVLAQLIMLGCYGTFKESTDVVFWIARPESFRDEELQLHREDGPAVTWDLGQQHYWHGVEVPGFVITSPHSITVDCIERENNNEARRVMIERWPGGWAQYLACVSELIDSRKNERDMQHEMLFRDPKNANMRKFLVADPSTGRRYALNVPWDLKTCEDAQRWLSHGLDMRAIHRS